MTHHINVMCTKSSISVNPGRVIDACTHRLKKGVRHKVSQTAACPEQTGLKCLAQGHNGGRLYNAGSFRYTLQNEVCSVILRLRAEPPYQQESFFSVLGVLEARLSFIIGFEPIKTFIAQRFLFQSSRDLMESSDVLHCIRCFSKGIT